MGMEKTLYEFKVDKRPGAISKKYVAKILGSHPKYGFQRAFAPLRCTGNCGDALGYAAEVDDFGVYECSVKWFEGIPDGRFLGRKVTWFVMFDGLVDHEVPKEEVLEEVKFIKRFLRFHKEFDVA